MKLCLEPLMICTVMYDCLGMVCDFLIMLCLLLDFFTLRFGLYHVLAQHHTDQGEQWLDGFYAELPERSGVDR